MSAIVFEYMDYKGQKIPMIPVLISEDGRKHEVSGYLDSGATYTVPNAGSANAGSARPFSACRYCGVNLNLPETPNFCPYCKKTLR